MTKVLVINRPMDDMEDKLVSEFIRSGCGCTKDKGKPCSQLFSPEYVKSVRASCAELTREELDMVIVGQLVACMNTSATVSTAAWHKESERYTTESHPPPGCSDSCMALGKND